MKVDIDNIEYLLTLHTVIGLGPVRLKLLLDYFQDAKVAWEADTNLLIKIGIPKNVANNLKELRKTLNPKEYKDEIDKDGIKYITIFDENYPKLLKQIYDPPIVLYYKGDFEKSDEKAIAIVGTRKMTGYGKVVTKQFAAQLSSLGFTIISGLARGVDSQAHKSAIDAGGRTIAVLGGGLNSIYPPENIHLANEIIDGHGVILSEFPPNIPSTPGNFPARNRIISGLALATLVTEADSDSGSLITARLALEQGRSVFAIPGPITSSLSQGPIELIKEGARPILKVEDILEDIGMDNAPILRTLLQDLTEIEEKVLEVLEDESLHIDQICRKLNKNTSEVLATLLKLEISGAVKNLGAGVYCR